MTDNGGGGGGGGAGASAVVSLNAAATVINSADTRHPAGLRQRKWIRYLRRLSCFGGQKRTKRIVPASRIPDGPPNGNRANGGQQAGAVVQPTALAPSLLAPPSSPASFTNSGNPSSVQSPNGLFSLSANVCSPGGPTSTMFATGPYAHETQLVSPPVFSTFTTEPSTAPFTPPPELAHLTTPSSPDVPFAQLLQSSLDVKTSSSENGITFSSSYTSPGYVCANDLQAAYQLQPGSPASQMVSPKPGVASGGSSLSFPDLHFPAKYASCSGQDSFFSRYEPKSFNPDPSASRSFMLLQDSVAPGFTALEESEQLHNGCHSVEKQFISSSEYDNARQMQQHRHSEANKSDVDQVEASYRASFGFSADEITTSNCAFSEVLGDNIVISPFGAQKIYPGESGSGERRSAMMEMESSDLVFFDSANVASPSDHDLSDMEVENRNYYAGEEEYGAFRTSEAGSAQLRDTDGLKFNEFKFDKKDGASASSSIIEKWARYREKLMVQNMQKEQLDFHVIHPQEELHGEKSP